MVLAGKLKRPKALAAAALLILASAMPIVAQRHAAAWGLISARKITMGSSANGTLAAGQDVTYEVSFNVATDTSDIAGLVVDFCSNSPIIKEACTAPTGFDIDASNLAVTINQGLTGFTKSTVESDANTLVLTAGAPWNPGVAAPAVFTLGTAAANDGIDNPENVNTTFYARIVTFTTATGANDYDSSTVNANNPGNEPPVVDAGGVALSTAAQITVTSKVQEKLDFCVYTSAITASADCSTASGTAIALGDTNGVLSTNGAFVSKEAKYSVATNASTGVAIRLKGTTLTSGSFTINATGAAHGAQSATNTEQFGICTYRDTVNGAAGLDPADGYDGNGAVGLNSTACEGTTQSSGTGSVGGHNNAFFTYDDNGTTGTTSTYGQTIANKAAGNFSAGIIPIIGNIAYTTEAGIYTTVLTFIATGTY